MTPLRLILASRSPRRRQLLDELGVVFSVRAIDVDESTRSGEPAAAYVERLALEKAQARVEPDELVLGADTTVVLDGEILGKPDHRAEAQAMLERLSGRRHHVLTGIALAWRHHEDELVSVSAIESTMVEIAPLDTDELTWYAATGEGDDKAGAYAIQGLGSLFVRAIAGSYSNVVGLPIATVYRLAAARGLGHLFRCALPSS